MSSRFFLGVGAQKAGTTWLHEQLSLHPDISLGTRGRKEIHYFDSAFPTRTGQTYLTVFIQALRRAIERGDKARAKTLVDIVEMVTGDPEGYRSILASRPTSVSGEITPGYSILSKKGFQAAQDLLSPQVIFIMRDPLARYWSAVRMHARNVTGGIVAESNFDSLIDRDDMWARSDYSTVVGLLDDIFGDQVLYLFYEDLFRPDTLRQVATHLSVEPNWNWDIERVSNSGGLVDMPTPPRRVIDRLLPIYKDMHERFGSRVPAAWQY